MTPWSPDGRTLLFSRRGEDGLVALWKIDLDARKETQLTHPKPGEFDMAGSWAFAGDRIVFSRSGASGGSLLVMPAAGGEPREIVSKDRGYFTPSWAPDSRSVVYSTNEGGLWVVDVQSKKKRQLTAGTTEEDSPVVSRAGQVLYATFSHQTDLYIQNVNGTGEERLTFHTQDNFGPQFSPDGKKVVYMSTRTGDAEVWLIDLANGNERQLTNRVGRDGAPVWNPNGHEVCFVSDRDGKSQLWAVGVESGAPRKLVDHEVDFGMWSPDGARIGFLTTGDPGGELWVMDAQGGEPKKVLEGVNDFGWYVDATHVIYTPRAQVGANQMRAVDLETGDETVLLDEPHVELAVAPDGSAVSFCSATSHYNMNLHIQRLERSPDGGLPKPVGNPVKITRGDGKWHVHNGGWSPDGKRVIYTRDTDTGDLYVLDGAF
jgi:TolB protein